MNLALTPENLILAALAIPTLAALLIPLCHRAPNLREAVTLISAGMLAIVVWHLLPHVMAGGRPEVALFRILPGVDLAFKVEPLGLVFALVASSLWPINSIYSIGYMRGNGEPRQTTFYVCFAVAIASALGIAFAKNLFTLFIFYELLTISTYPLVTHKGSEEAMQGGRVYLVLLLATSMVLLLPAIIATGVVAGTLDFAPGGILAGKLSPLLLGALLALYVFGIGKAALMPFHFWLPAAMVAPTPVSALLHAVAVVKAGVFTVLKVVVYVFGLDVLSKSGSSEWLTYVASGALLLASLIALMQTNLKARLAYSTVSQLSYVILAAALATGAGAMGGALHIVMHAAGKITLFFCAGAIYVAHHKTEIHQLDGIGHKMPITMFAFLIGSLSVIGLPPLGGSWSKWLIGLGSVDAGFSFVIGVLMLSSLLNVAYLMPIVARAYFVPSPGEQRPPGDGRMQEAPIACLVPMVCTSLLCLILFFFAGDVERLIALAIAKP
ncbi:MAG: monovalent cation/H+ antiporter subunit D family protein [Hyphomicrobiaceae bacterium]|nr:monovalent cation/H+ antiporter subunit D family protein [Hyphomicrobiaceae bacterium]